MHNSHLLTIVFFHFVSNALFNGTDIVHPIIPVFKVLVIIQIMATQILIPLAGHYCPRFV